MDELKNIASYEEFDKKLETELRKNAEGFVRIGYLLRVAEDTDILKESGFSTVAEYAKEKYGLTKDVVSRYIAINKKYSQDGYSEYLEEKYVGYGVAKLQEMLTLPEEITDELDPQMTKSEIQGVKKEYQEEQQITPLEGAMEQTESWQQDIESNLAKTLYAYYHEEPEAYVKLFAFWTNEYGNISSEKILDEIAPSGVKTMTARVMGVGRLMLSIHGIEKDLSLVNMRSGEKETYTWEEFYRILDRFIKPEGTGENSWAKKYKEAYPKKEEVAPVQPKEEDTKGGRDEGSTENQGTRSTASEAKTGARTGEEQNGSVHATEESSREKTPDETVKEEEQVEQVPGQTSIENDFKEMLTEEKASEAHEITPDVVQEGQTVRNILRSGNEYDILRLFTQEYGLDIKDEWLNKIVKLGRAEREKN